MTLTWVPISWGPSIEPSIMIRRPRILVRATVCTSACGDSPLVISSCRAPAAWGWRPSTQCRPWSSRTLVLGRASVSKARNTNVPGSSRLIMLRAGCLQREVGHEEGWILGLVGRLHHPLQRPAGQQHDGAGRERDRGGFRRRRHRAQHLGDRCLVDAGHGVRDRGVAVGQAEERRGVGEEGHRGDPLLGCHHQGRRRARRGQHRRLGHEQHVGLREVPGHPVEGRPPARARPARADQPP